MLTRLHRANGKQKSMAKNERELNFVSVGGIDIKRVYSPHSPREGGNVHTWHVQDRT